MNGNGNRRPAWLIAGALLMAALLQLVSAVLGDGRQPATPAGAGLPPVPVPEDNPITPAKVALGEKLFFDPGLSADGSISCASCHRPERYFADDKPFSRGVGEKPGERNALSVLNAGYSPNLLWDGRSVTLEDQVRYPVTHPLEMNMTPERVEDYLVASPEYAALFKEAFGEDWIAWENVCRAVATFERTLLIGNAPFDRFIAGHREALPAAARRGWELFRGKAGCIGCHRYDRESPFFTDFEFHNAGIGWSAAKPDLGRYHITKVREEKGAFRTPSLRNVAKTAPYMHDGSLPDLPSVIAHYVAGGKPNPLLDPKIRPLELSVAEQRDLIAFLESLTSETTYQRVAAAPPP
jgi:cytochrome c peroxidase